MLSNSRIPTISKHGVMHKSPLGVRYRSLPGLPYLQDQMIMVFIDESTPYSDGGADWITDLARWTNLIRKYGTPEWGVVMCDVDDDRFHGEPAPSTPPNITIYRNFPRKPPTEFYFVDAYMAGYVGPAQVQAPSVKLLIDNSQSMVTDTLQYGLDEFKKWLDDGGTMTPDPLLPLPPILWEIVEFGHERWLDITCNYITTGKAV